MFIGLTCGAVIFTWPYHRSGSLIFVIDWHGMYDFVGATEAAAAGPLAAIVTTLIMVQGDQLGGGWDREPFAADASGLSHATATARRRGAAWSASRSRKALSQWGFCIGRLHVVSELEA